MHLFNPLDPSLGRNLRTHARLALAMGAALGLFALPAWAGDANCILGSWEGTFKEKDSISGQLRIIPVLLDIASLEKDTDKSRAGLIRFPPPRACRLSLSYSGENENQYYLTMSEPNGGLCVRLTNVQLRLECMGPTELTARYEYRDAQNAMRVEEIKLRRGKQAPAPKAKSP